MRIKVIFWIGVFLLSLFALAMSPVCALGSERSALNTELSALDGHI